MHGTGFDVMESDSRDSRSSRDVGALVRVTVVALFLVLGGGPAAFGQISTTGLLDHFNPNLGVTTDGNGNVTGWTNQATPGRSVIAGNATTTVVAGPNGSMLRFDAADGSGQLAYASAGSAAYADGLTVFTVVRFNSPTSSWNQFPRLWRGANDNVAVFLRTSGVVEVKLGGYSRPISSYTNVYQLGDPTANPPTLGQVAIVATRASATERQLLFNGSVAATQSGGSSTFAVDNTTLQIGNSVRGDIGDVLVYDSSVTVSGFNETGLALAQAYGVGWTVGGGSPSVSSALSVPVTVTGGTLGFTGSGSTSGSVTVDGGSVAFGGTTVASGSLSVNRGSISFAGGSSVTGTNEFRLGQVSGQLARATMATSGSLSFNNSSFGRSGGSGSLAQTSGDLRLGTGGYLNLGQGAGTYGHYLLGGGSYASVSGNAQINVGDGGLGVLEMTGGAMTINRYLVIGNGGGSTGQMTITGGTMTHTANGNWFLVGDDGPGRLNVGTLAGGAARIVSGANLKIGEANNTVSSQLNLNAGTIEFTRSTASIRADIDKSPDRSLDLSLNGGRIRSGAADITLILGGVDAPDRTMLFNGGVTIDTNGFNAAIATPVIATTGNGFYRSTTFTATPTGAAGAGYIGPPIVAVSGGSGSGAQVNALVDTDAGTITGFVVTNPGQGYQAGDTLTFTLSGNAGSTLAAPYSYTLQPADLAANGTGIFRKEGNGILTLSAANTFTGETRIAAGTLRLAETGSLLSSLITIDSGATFDASLVSGFALLPGQALGGRGTFSGSVLLNDGAGLVFDAAGPFTIAGGTMSFGAGFGIADIIGLDATVSQGTYTLVAGSVDLSGLANVGFANRAGIGGGKEAYFQEGSLQLVVVPEPGTVALTALGLILGGLAWTRRRGRRCPA
jgi:autotransporter-associated beta strand protein